jgi:hypothetical protein
VRLSVVGLTITLAVLIISALALVLYGGEIGKAVANCFGFGEAFRLASHILLVANCDRLPAACLRSDQLRCTEPPLSELVLDHTRLGDGAVLWLVVSFCFRIYLYCFDRYRRDLCVARSRDHPDVAVLRDGRSDSRRWQGLMPR